MLWISDWFPFSNNFFCIYLYHKIISIIIKRDETMTILNNNETIIIIIIIIYNSKIIMLERFTTLLQMRSLLSSSWDGSASAPETRQKQENSSPHSLSIPDQHQRKISFAHIIFIVLFTGLQPTPWGCIWTFVNKMLYYYLKYYSYIVLSL